MEITTEERRCYFSDFYCEILSSDIQNKEDIKSFVSKKVNNSLEDYILNEAKAWKDDLEGETRVYLIKDKAGSIACYFSLKCGILCGSDAYEKLPDDEREIIKLYVDARKDKDEIMQSNYYAYIQSEYPDKAEKLIEIAMNRYERKTEAIIVNQSESTINVPVAYSAIEIVHLCKNENYTFANEVDVPHGFGLFWEVIVPKVISISEKIGCKYLYMFAANDENVGSCENLKKLVQHYKNGFKFRECGDGLKLIKPDYNQYCYGLQQEISELGKNRRAIWEEFADV